MRGFDTRGAPPARLPDAALWRASGMIDMAEDEAERYLDLAGYADGRLDPDDCERVEEWLAADPEAAGDIAAARLLGGSTAQPEAVPEPAIARACALIGGGEARPDTVIAFAARYRVRPSLHGMAGWSSLVAAMAVASWLGFTLGMDTSRSFAQIHQAPENGFLGELLNPSLDAGRDLSEGNQT